MRTAKHQSHIDSLVAHNDCRECRADTERRFVAIAKWDYRHVHEYLCYVAPLLREIRNGNDSVQARQWLRDFRVALDRSAYLRNFARIGASALKP